MNIERWLKLNTCSLKGKTVAVTGSTGGLGVELCKNLARLGANLILVDRNKQKSEAFAQVLREIYSATVSCITADLEVFSSVIIATEQLETSNIDIFIHNAGAYSIPRKICDTGYDNVFQINFVSPYYMIKRLLPVLKKRGGRVMVVGSIAHNYNKIDEKDIDFSSRTAASSVYGNAKRFLMFALYEFFKNETEVTLSVTHPGITFTNITAHYPKLIFAVIKHPMKVIFMKPKKAVLSLVKGCFEATPYHTWIGPKLFNVWGYPKKQRLKTCTTAESQRIDEMAERIFQQLTFKQRKAFVKSYLGKTVDIKIDRPIGYVHKKENYSLTYPINYGYIPEVLGGDGEELDVYLLGVNEPVTEYKAKIIGIAHRENDVEDKLIAAPENMSFTKEEIEKTVNFQEQYYKTYVEVEKC